MDAHDEFFSIWSEPEGWCERCGEYPAIHLIMQSDEAPHEKFVAYARAWDPHTQDYIVLCRWCSKEHVKALGSQAPENTQAPPSSTGAAPGKPVAARQYHWWQQLWCWGATFLTILMNFWRCQKVKQQSPTPKPLSPSGT
jgi:hypothetical protein